MLYHQGARSRMPIYVDEFRGGIHKAENVLKRSLEFLDDPACLQYLKVGSASAKSHDITLYFQHQGVADRALRNKTRDQRKFEAIVFKAFNENRGKYLLNGLVFL